MNKKFWLSFLLIIGLTAGMLNQGGRAQTINSPGSSRLPVANTWYVSTHGNDANDCASPSTACAKINAAVQKAASGDGISVASGVYTNTVAEDNITIPFNLSISGGWDETFSSQEGISTIEGQRLGGCIETSLAIDVTINKLVLNKCGRDANPYDGEPSIYNQGRLLITDSVIQYGNHIDNSADGELSLVGVIVRNNGDQYGGGIYSGGKLFLNQDAISHNFAFYYGGGVVVVGSQAIIINTTINDNTAVYTSGGGVSLPYTASASIYNSTIIHNQGQNGTGGLYNSPYSTVTLYNTIIADNWQGRPPTIKSDCSGTISSGDYNLISDTTGCNFVFQPHDQLGVLPQAYLLDTYFALSPGSPAIDSGNPAGCLDVLGNPILTDQRGTIRPLDGNGDGTAVCDVGAYEFDPNNPPLFNYLPFANHPCPIIYFDNFEDPSSGWPVVDNGKSLVEYNNGEYRMMARPTYWGIAVRPGFYGDTYKLSVDLRNVTGVEGSYGLLFGISPDWSRFYSFELYQNGWYGVYYYDYNYNPPILRVLAEQFSSAINQGIASNHILIEKIGDQASMYANGQLLIHVRDGQMQGFLYAGLIIWSYSQPNVDIRFDNFKVGPMNCTDVRPSGLQTNPADASWIEKSPDFSGKLPVATRHQP